LDHDTLYCIEISINILKEWGK